MVHSRLVVHLVSSVSAAAFSAALAVLGGVVAAAPAALLLCGPLGGAARAQTLQSTLTASDAGAGDFFGAAISIDGDTIVSGARNNLTGKGAAYVYRSNGSTWTQEAKLTGAGALAQDQVGYSVSVNAGAAVLGAPEPIDLFGAEGPGSVYVFRRSGTTWSQEAKLTAGDGQVRDEFGFASSLSGAACAIGAPGDLNSGTGSRSAGRGSVYVFRKSGATWTQEAKLVSGDGVAGDLFGTSAAIEADVFVAGAPGDSDAGAGSGSAYVFRKSGATWTQEAKLVAGDAAAGDGFGYAVAISGNVVAVGSYHDNAGATSDTGSVYVFRKNGAVWSQEAKLTAGDPAANDALGSSVGVLGNQVVAGASGKAGGVGAAYVFHKPAASWVQQMKITKSGTSLLGHGVAITGDHVALGAPATDGANAFSGAAYAYNVAPPAGLVSINPVLGLFHTPTPVTLTGTNFSQFAPATVTFGGVPATSVAWVSPTQMTCLSPTGTQGQVVGVSFTQYGVQTNLPSAYTYAGTTVTTVTPNSGPSVGGPPVTISGSFFINNGSTTVNFGANAASIVSITPPSTIVVNVPPGTRGTTVDVSVNSSNGFGVKFGAFTYDTPTIATVTPAVGASAGGTPVTISGTNFVNDGSTVVTFGTATASIVTITPPGTILVNAPPGTPGSTVDVSVTSNNGIANKPNAFTYQLSTITTVTPVSGPAAGGTPVTISGTNFVNDGSTVVTFGAAVAGIVSITPPSTILVNAPAGTPGSTVGVSVASSNGLANKPNAFTWHLATIATVSPNSGPSVGGPPVTITGTNFVNDGSTVVKFGANPAGIVSITPTTIVVNVPPGTRGTTVNVSVECSNGVATKTNAFTYDVTTIATVSPGSGPSVGGPPVTITGTNFVNDGSTVVTFGAAVAGIVSITPPSTIVVNVPPGTRGSTVAVSVDCSNGFATKPDAFTYATLGVLAINTPAGNITGGTPLTVTVDYGTNLADTSATLGGSPVTVTGATATTVSFTAPAIVQATGDALDVSVTNSNGTGTLFGAFTYTPALSAAVTGNTVAGGVLTLDWTLDPAAGAAQLVTIWVGDFNPPLNAPVFGYAGLLGRFPLVWLLMTWPEATKPVPLAFGPLDPILAGLPLHLQAIVTGEGGLKGSFSNDEVFVIP